MDTQQQYYHGGVLLPFVQLCSDANIHDCGNLFFPVFILEDPL